MIMKTSFEENGGTYSTAGDYRLPKLAVLKEPEYYIGVWGRRRLDYLKHHRCVLYVNLLTSGKLSGHLADTNCTAQEMFDELVRGIALKQRITEQLKAENQMEWVGRMNSIRFCAEEIVGKQIIYI